MRVPVLLLAATVLLAACGRKAPPPRAPLAETLPPGEAPQAVEGPVQMDAPPEPKPGESLYVVHLRDDQGRPVAGVRTMMLIQEPEGLYILEPRRKQVVAEFKTPKNGRVIFLVQSDGKPKTLWVGGRGFQPFTKAVPAATSQSRFETTVTVEILPILTAIIEDFQGNRVSDAIVTMRPVPGDAPLDARMAEVYKRAQRSDDLGEVKITRRPGRYNFIATKGNGTCRLTLALDWDGDPAPRTFRLPERSPGKGGG